MKKRKKMIICLILLFIIIFIILLSHNGNDSFYKKLKSLGFTDLDEHFICSAISNKKDLMMSTRKYSFIAINGKVYDISFSRTFKNGENCEKRKFDTKLISHIDDIVIGENGKYYSIYENLSEKENIEFSYETKDIVHKAYQFILKKDGNIYFQENEDDSSFTLKYKKEEFDGKIQNIAVINSNYTVNETRKIVVMTENAIYYTKATNKDECRKFADVICDYEMVKDDLLSKNRKYILFVDDTNLITKDGKVLYTNNYFDQ